MLQQEEFLPQTKHRELVIDDFKKITSRYGFIETSEMVAARDFAIACLLQDGGTGNFKSAFDAYYTMCQSSLDQMPTNTQKREMAEAGFMLMRAAIFYLGGNKEEYANEMIDVRWFLRNILAKHRETFD